MYCKLIKITSPAVFKKYSQVYNVFRDLYEVYSFGLELKDLSGSSAEEIHKMLLSYGEICYIKENIVSKTDLFTIGSFSKLKEFAGIIRSKINEDIGFAIDQALHNYESYDESSIRIDGTLYPLNRIYVMGILNVTPDSFSDGGRYFSQDKAVKHAHSMLDNGADIIDVGGESTRPGSKPVTCDEELSRVLPVIKEIKTDRNDAVISIDTTKARVAEKALDAGASIVNDISGLTFDDNMADVIADKSAAAIIMHIKGEPENMQINPYYEDVQDEVFGFLDERIKFARKKKIHDIIIDPGFGFGKRLNDNYDLLNSIGDFKTLGCPILAGISRKSMLGKALDLDVADREAASIIAETMAVANGARFIRTHNVVNATKLKKLYSFVTNPEIIADV